MFHRLRAVAVVLAVLLVGGSLVAQDIVEREAGLFSTVAIQDTLKIGAQDKITIKSVASLMGSLSITVAEQDHVLLTYYKQARTRRRSDAVDYIDLITVSLRTMPDQVRLELRAPNPTPWSGTGETGLVEVELVLPVNFKVDIDATYFDVIAQGPLLGLAATPSLGSFDVSTVDGIIDIATKNQRVKLRDIAGDISASTSNSTMTVNNGRSSGRNATFRNEGGDIKIDGFTGELNVKAEYGRIDVRAFKSQGDGTYLRGLSAPVTVELTDDAGGSLVVKNRYEDISLTVPDTISAYFMLSVDEDGLIEAVNFPFKTDLVERDRLNLMSREGDIEIIASVKGKGNVYVRGVEGD